MSFRISGGEKTKVLLASLFMKETNFLLIDEPTNHLDMNSRTIVSKYLKSKKGFILVSHDRLFLDTCVDHILSINKSNIEIQKGNFSSWWQNKIMQDNYELAENEKLKKELLSGYNPTILFVEHDKQFCENIATRFVYI